MALTPDDVVKKTFQPTKFREGYDQDEVDDFLDEVVSELRRLIAESDDLREKLAACEARGGGQAASGASTQAPSSLQKVSGGADAQPAPAIERPAAQSGQSPSGQSPSGQSPSGQSPSGQSPTQGAATAPASAAAVGDGGDPQAVTGMLALAQRLHDEHVRSGEEQRDRLLEDARTRAEALVGQAEEHRTQTLGSLEQERSLLERRIDELRSFERDYRARLKAYLESQLRDLDTKAAVGATPGQPAAADGSVASG